MRPKPPKIGDAAEPGDAPESSHAPLRVLIVDDSAVMCRALTEMLSSEEGIHVVGTARNGEEALEQIDRVRPDLITLDVNMPVMDGSTALKHIMIRNPCPVVIVSAVSQRRESNILNFLLLGAVDYIQKPVRGEAMARQRLIHSVGRRRAARGPNGSVSEGKAARDRAGSPGSNGTAHAPSQPRSAFFRHRRICGAGKNPFASSRRFFGVRWWRCRPCPLLFGSLLPLTWTDAAISRSGSFPMPWECSRAIVIWASDDRPLWLHGEGEKIYSWRGSLGGQHAGYVVDIGRRNLYRPPPGRPALRCGYGIAFGTS